jgi:hypothetical protein
VFLVARSRLIKAPAGEGSSRAATTQASRVPGFVKSRYPPDI